MHPNERDANAPRQIIKNWDGKPIPQCPSLLDLASFNYRIRPPTQVSEDEYLLLVSNRKQEEIDAVYKVLPKMRDKAINSSDIAHKLGVPRSTIDKRLRHLFQTKQANRYKDEKFFYYWRT